MTRTKRCDIGSLSADPCMGEAVCRYVDNHGRDLHVCLDCGIEAFGWGFVVEDDEGRTLVSTDDDYVFSDGSDEESAS